MCGSATRIWSVHCRENAKHVPFFLLARFDKTEETKRVLHEIDTDPRHPFLCMVPVLGVCFRSHELPGEKVLNCFMRKASKGGFI